MAMFKKPPLTREQAADAFAEVIGMNRFQALDIMRHLVMGYSGPDGLLEDYVYRLPVYTTDSSTDGGTIVSELGRGGRRTPVNTTVPHKTGALGTVTKSKNDDKYAWKRVTIETEQEAREMFMEAFALAVLQSDPDFTNSTCGIYSLYRNSDVVRTVPGSTPRTSSNHYSFRMPLYTPLRDLPSYCCGSIPFSLSTMAPILHDISSILIDLHTKYQFVHNDLHTGNVMFNSNKPVLIDFGRASMVIDGTRYKCFDRGLTESFDMLIYILCLVQDLGKTTTTVATTGIGRERNKYNTLLAVPDKTGTPHYLLIGASRRLQYERFLKPKSQLFHMGYSYHLSEWEEPFRRALYDNDSVGPTNGERLGFLEIIHDKTRDMGYCARICTTITDMFTRGRKRRQSRKRRNSRKRRQSRKHRQCRI
jgi:serine/threonine protein kinase